MVLSKRTHRMDFLNVSTAAIHREVLENPRVDDRDAFWRHGIRVQSLLYQDVIRWLRSQQDGGADPTAAFWQQTRTTMQTLQISAPAALRPTGGTL